MWVTVFPLVHPHPLMLLHAGGLAIVQSPGYEAMYTLSVLKQYQIVHKHLASDMHISTGLHIHIDVF